MRDLYIALLLLLLAGCRERTHESSVPSPLIVTKDTSPPPSKDLSSAPTKLFYGDSIYYTSQSLCTLKGKLIQKVFWGQPGFGADTTVDAKWTFFVLVLDKPVTYIPNKYELSCHIDTIHDIDSIQIEDQRGNPDLLEKVGCKTTLQGNLSAAIISSQCTPVTLDYKLVVK